MPPPFPEPVEGKSERAALVRAAYGRTDSPDDEVRAAEARLALQQLDLQDAAERQALERATHDAADDRERRAQRIRSRSVRVLGTLVVLGLIAAGAATWIASPGPQPLGPSEAVPQTTGAPTRSQLSTSTTPAEAWFAAAQTDGDLTDSSVPAYVDGSTTRLASTEMPGWKVFVARGINAELCLVVQEAGTTVSVAECVDPEVFAASGVLVSSVGTTSISAFWDGYTVRVGQNGSSPGQN